MSRHGASDRLAPLPRRRLLSIAAGVVALHLGLLALGDRRVPPPARPPVVWLALGPLTQPPPSSPPPVPAHGQAATAAPQEPVPQDGPAVAHTPQALAQEPRPPALALPPPFEWRFVVYRGPAIVCSATLQLRLDSLPQPRYDLRWTETAAGAAPSLSWHSQGAVDASGLVPHRLVESRQGRDRRAINVDPDAGWVSASASTHREPAPQGVQDRLSWLVQFLALVRSRGASWRAGESITLAVAQWDGRVTPWQFVLRDAHEQAPGLWVWERLPTQDYDAAVQIWLRPEAGHRLQRVIWQWAPHPEVTRWEAQE